MAPAPADADQAIAVARAGLGFLAAADPATMTTEAQARYLRLLEQCDAIAAAARARILDAFTAAQGHHADGAASPRAWLMHHTGITRAAAAAHAAWARRLPAHPQVAGALAAGELPESCARTLCGWVDQLPAECRGKAEEVLVTAAVSGLGLRDLAALAGEILDRARPRITPGNAGGDQDGGGDTGRDEAFEDRGVRAQVPGPGSASASASSSSGSTPPSLCFPDARIMARILANSAVADKSGSPPRWSPAFPGSCMWSLMPDPPPEAGSHAQHGTGNLAP